MAAWLPNLRTHIISAESDTEKSREKIATISRKLIEVALSDNSLTTTFETSVWPAICQDELHADIFLDELIKIALHMGSDEEGLEVLGSILGSVGMATTRGKVLSRLRKALNRTSLRPTRQLPDNNIWSEICILLRICLSMSFDNSVQVQTHLPELFHIVTMLSNTGLPEIRVVVRRLLVNSIHTMCTTFTLDETKLTRLTAILQMLSDPRSELFISVPRLWRDGVSMSAKSDTIGSTITTTEGLAMILSEVIVVAAPSVDVSNVWRCRWMSLVASTAFQSNPAIQPRAFTVMGAIVNGEENGEEDSVNDDLLYQLLVALRNGIILFLEDSGNGELLVAIVSCLTRMMEKLPMVSRYGLQLFWLAVSLVRLVPLGMYNCSALFLEAVLNNIRNTGDFQNGRLVQVLLQGRVQLEDAALELDNVYGVHFTADNFHLALCASLVKGLTEAVTRPTCLKVLTTLLAITGSNLLPGVKFPEDVTCLTYVALLISRCGSNEEAADIMWLVGVDLPLGIVPSQIIGMVDPSVMKDKDLLLNCALGIVDFSCLEDTVQYMCLLWLRTVAEKRPTVIWHL